MGRRVHSGPWSARQGARLCTIVRWRGLSSHSTRTWWSASAGARWAHHRRTRATSVSGNPVADTPSVSQPGSMSRRRHGHPAVERLGAGSGCRTVLPGVWSSAGRCGQPDCWGDEDAPDQRHRVHAGLRYFRQAGPGRSAKMSSSTASRCPNSWSASSRESTSTWWTTSALPVELDLRAWSDRQQHPATLDDGGGPVNHVS